MRGYTALLSDRTAMPALAMPLTCSDPAAVAAHVMGLPKRVATVFVIGLECTDSIAVQAETAGAGPFVVAEFDVVCAALAAAAASVLRTRGSLRGRGRVAVSGADSAPPLEAVLCGAGARAVTTFSLRDVSMLPLRALMSGHDVLIDFTGTVSHVAAPDRVLSVPIDLFDSASLVLPAF
ncbi:hypothetical protein AB0M12_17925 [Nocardia vinacea]|uniref:hypothetical protein n=1 Tax=Nocardia vinacea TaxID=96468 RepID=UPI0034152B78